LADRLDHPQWITSAPVADAVRFGTSIMRGHPFDKGLLGRAVESDVTGATVARLRGGKVGDAGLEHPMSLNC
jgi:hypothetical protein